MPGMPEDAEKGAAIRGPRVPEGEGLVEDANSAAGSGGAASEESTSAVSDVQAGFIAGAAAADVAVSVASIASSANETAGAAAGGGENPIPGAEQAKGIKDQIAEKGDALKGARKAADDAAGKDEDSADIEE
jgi:hypothetical protein